MWWALIEEITPRAKEMACCVRGYHVYLDIWGAAIWEVLVCSTEPTNVGTIFVKLNLHKISYVFCVRKYFYNENKANYGKFCCRKLMGVANGEIIINKLKPNVL